MNKNTLVSVLLTSFNRPKMIKEAIDSVLNQTFEDFELIILDDNSDEKTLKVIWSYLDNPKVSFYKSNANKDIKIRRKGPASFALLINQGLRLAKGEYITYICDDDLYYPERLDEMVKFMEKHPKVSIIYNQINWKSFDGTEVNVAKSPDIVLSHPEYRIDHISIMHKKKCSDEVGGWATKSWVGADTGFYKKLREAGYLFYPTKKTLEIHRHHKDTLHEKYCKRKFEFGKFAKK